ncbi:MAG: conjugal transfer protein TraF [Muribaculaceae bacterium]|nr:conjugal transfer protein TraF [Muribaculaceae bacterium]
MMKKILYLFAAALLSVAAASCSSKATTDDGREITASPEAGPDGIVMLTQGDYYTAGQPVDRLTVIDFNAKWCGPCRAFAPVFEEAAEKYKGKVTFVSVDIDSVPDMMPEFGLEAIIPTVLIIRPDGSYVSYVGTGDLMPYDKFASLIDTNLNTK